MQERSTPACAQFAMIKGVGQVPCFQEGSLPHILVEAPWRSAPTSWPEKNDISKRSPGPEAGWQHGPLARNHLEGNKMIEIYYPITWQRTALT